MKEILKEISMLNFNNVEKKNKSYMHQNLQKSKCFNCDFSNSNFDNVSFRGAHMKSCNFFGASFKSTEFVGTNLKGSDFRNAVFENAVFEGAKMEEVNFRGASFKNTFFIQTNLDSVKGIDQYNPEIRIYNEMPTVEMSSELTEIIEKLMANEFIKKSRVLDTKDKTINTISVIILLEKFGEEVLLNHLGKIEKHIDRDFYTLSYIMRCIEKVMKEDGAL